MIFWHQCIMLLTVSQWKHIESRLICSFTCLTLHFSHQAKIYTVGFTGALIDIGYYKCGLMRSESIYRICLDLEFHLKNWTHPRCGTASSALSVNSGSDSLQMLSKRKLSPFLSYTNVFEAEWVLNVLHIDSHSCSHENKNLQLNLFVLFNPVLRHNFIFN